MLEFPRQMPPPFGCIKAREQAAAARKAGNLGLQTDGRPTKKQRRQIHQFREYVHPFDD